jgi:excisionase family DNA binding protein
MGALDRLLTVREVVVATGLSERTIRGMIASGRLTVIRPGGLRAVRISEAAVHQLLEVNGQAGR